MIIIKLKGGLGNQMFQYSFGRFLSIKNNTVLKIDIKGLKETSKETERKYLLDKFNTLNIEADDKEIFSTKYPFNFFSKLVRFLKIKILRKFYINFEPKLLNLKGNLYLDGFYQSENYFKPIEKVIRKEFTLKEPLSPIAQNISNQILDNENSVSIHIRRGDYVSDKKTNSHHGTCDIDYYNKAIKYIKDKIQSPVFFVFSDDINWAKENIKKENSFFISSPELKDYEELIIMSNCRHQIIANSSFSWWAAWLNQNPNKIVIAPQKWLNTDISKQPDIVPSTWIKI